MRLRTQFKRHCDDIIDSIHSPQSDSSDWSKQSKRKSHFRSFGRQLDVVDDAVMRQLNCVSSSQVVGGGVSVGGPPPGSVGRVPVLYKKNLVFQFRKML